MDARATHSQSPQPSPHGAIGEFPGGISGSSGGVGSTPSHARSSSFATRPRTPQVTGTHSASASAGSGDELDLNALMAHGQRQLEMDTSRNSNSSRFGRFSSAGTRADSPSRVSRWDDEWRSGTSGTRSRDTSMRRQASTNSINGSITPVATGAPTNLSSFLDNNFPSPLGAGLGSGMGGGMGAAVSSGVGTVGSVPGVGRSRTGFSASTPSSAHSTGPMSHQSDPSAATSHHLNALNNLLQPLIAQSDEVIRLRAEVELWRGEWQRCDRERRRLEGVLNSKNNEPIDGPPFSAVLIDGDGLIFQDEFLREGHAGGQRAARALVAALPNLAESVCSPTTNHGSSDEDKGAGATGEARNARKRDLGAIVVQVFINKQGLGSALVKSGSVPSWTVYEGFWQGFTSAHDLFSVVDAGHGKEATDHKIREYLKLYSSHRQCSTIFLGISHDNSYANVLSSLETTSGLSKLVLLKGYADIAQGLKQYAGRFVTIPDLFRPSKLVVPAVKDKEAKSDGSNNATPPLPTGAGTTSNALKSPRRRPPVPLIVTPPPPTWREDEDEEESDSDSSSVTSAQVDVDVEVIEWDGLPDQETPQISRRTRASSRPRGVRADDDDKDEKKKGVTGKKYKPAARAASVPTVRNLKPRPCHTFYLSPWGCKNGDGCEYAHHYKLNEEQTEELARLAKEIICPYVRSKRCHFSEDECVYGHRCPRGERCTFGDTCRFKDLPNGHGEDSRA